MPEYSPLVILFITTHLISLCLLSFLIYIILKTGSYITKWTLFQLCICLFVLGLSSLPPIIIYGDSLKILDVSNSPLCIIQSKIITFLYCPLKLFPAALCVYLFAVARYNYNIEQKYFWYMSGSIWVITFVMNILSLNGESKEDNWGVQPSFYFCKAIPSNFEWYSYIIPTSVLAIVGLFITAYSSYILWNLWRNFNQKQNRRTAINLGYSVRLTVLSGVYSCILIVSLILVITKKLGQENLNTQFLDFGPSFFGAIIFMIFGTTKSAAIFLPCCYYVPPSDRKKQRSTISQYYYNNENLHDTVEFDTMVAKGDECPKDESNFNTINTISTRVTMPDDYYNYEQQQ